jgi:hypothetical protein
MLLSDIAGGLCEGDIEIRGRKVRARAVSAAESGRIQKLRPAPQPPPSVRPGLKPGEDPNDHIIYNDRDPRHIAAYAEWTRWVKAAEVIVALGVRHAEKAWADFGHNQDAELLAWLNSAVDRLCSSWSREELGAAWDSLATLGRSTPDRMKAAEGN